MKDQAIDALTSLGLSQGEAKTYLALATVNSSEATPLADLAGVPQPRVYSYLEGLEARHLIVKTEISGKPNTYSAEDIDVVFKRLRNQLDQNILAAKEYIRDKQKESVSKANESVTVVQGESAIRNRLESIGKSARSNMLLMYHHFYAPLVEKFYSHLDLDIIEPLDYMRQHPLIGTLLSSPVAQRLKEKKIMLIVTDINLDEQSASSINIVAFGDEKIEPILIQITHPVILGLQMGIIGEIIQSFGNSN